MLEQGLAELVNLAYGLTSEDGEALWRTIPPRTPVAQPPTIKDNMDGDETEAGYLSPMLHRFRS